MAKLLVTEGLDYAGKSSTIEQLSTALRACGWHTVIYREPGASEVGDALKKLLIDPAMEMDEKTRIMLFFASRNELITRHLNNLSSDDKTVVILDRYLPTTFAYCERCLWPFIWSLKTLIAPPVPDITVYLELDQKTFLQRLNDSKRNQQIDGIEAKLKDNFPAYSQRYDDYFERADNGDLLRLKATDTVESNVFRILNALERIT